MDEISFLQYFLPKNIYIAIQILVGSTLALIFLYRAFKFLRREIGDIKETHRKINVIFSELTPNHGSSIKDKVTKIDQQINRIDQQLEDNTNMTSKIFDRQRWILDNENIIVFESDNDGKCIWVNKRYCEWLDRDMPYFMGMGWKNAIHQDDRDKVGEEWESAVKDSRDSENFYRMIDKSGNIYNVHCVANKSVDKNGYMGCIKVLSQEAKK